MDNKIFKLVFIGAGNVAFSLAKRCKEVGHEISQIYARNPVQANEFAEVFKVDIATKFSDITRSADYYFLCVNDDAINVLSKKLAEVLPNTSIILHTSGSRGVNEIDAYFLHRINFYPLQTFLKYKNPNWDTIPLFIEANSIDFENHKLFFDTICKRVIQINNDIRIAIHVAAVFVNNFTNSNMIIAQDILAKAGLTLEVLYPLINNTFNSVLTTNPLETQTGPAKRNDTQTINLHKEYIEENCSEILTIYDDYTKFILERFYP